jgi:hypothetical protein
VGGKEISREEYCHSKQLSWAHSQAATSPAAMSSSFSLTLTHFILAKQQLFPEATGDFTIRRALLILFFFLVNFFLFSRVHCVDDARLT